MVPPASLICRAFKALLGRSQVVRQRILISSGKANYPSKHGLFQLSVSLQSRSL
jgi:hypothetical protein